MSENAFVFRSDVLFFGVAERPDFIALNAFALDVADGCVVEFKTGRANVFQQLRYRID